MRNEYKLLNRANEPPPFGWGDSGDTRAVGGPQEKIDSGAADLFSPGDSPGGNYAATVALAVVLGLYLLDLMINAMVNPIFALVAGGLQMSQADDRITDV